MRQLFHTAATLLMATAAITAFNACSSKEKATANDSTEVELPVVEIRHVSEQDVPQKGLYTASVEAFKTNNISSSTPNRIKDILVDVGSKVAAGQKLVVLDDANIAQLKINIDNTEREYNRALQLLQIGGGTQQSVDQLKAQLDAQRRQYTNLVENTVLVSPVTGVVTKRNYDPGDMASGPILTIEQVRPVKVMVNVSEADFVKVRKGMPVTVTLDVYGDEKFAGNVSLIHPTIDPSTRTFTVEITIPNADERILPGMFARVAMDFGHNMHVVVPDRAVVKQSGSGNRFVYVYDPATSTVSYNKVELGQRIGDTYELLSGVPSGSEVVITGQTRLADGVKVKLLDDKK